MQKPIKHLAAIICIIVGIALSLYGLAVIVGLDSLAFGKFSAAARDTNSAILLFMIGVALALFGWFTGDLRGDNAPSE